MGRHPLRARPSPKLRPGVPLTPVPLFCPRSQACGPRPHKSLRREQHGGRASPGPSGPPRPLPVAVVAKAKSRPRQCLPGPQSCLPALTRGRLRQEPSSIRHLSSLGWAPSPSEPPPLPEGPARPREAAWELCAVCEAVDPGTLLPWLPWSARVPCAWGQRVAG